MRTTDSVARSRFSTVRARILISVLVLAAVLGFAVWFLAGKTAELAGVVRDAESLPLYVVMLAVVLELLSLLSYSSVSRSLLRGLGAPQSRSYLFLVSAAATALGNSVPLGAAASTVYFFRRLKHRGVSSSSSVVAIAGVNVMTVLSLCLLALVGVVGAENQAESAVSIGTVLTVVIVFGLMLLGAIYSDRVVGAAFRMLVWLRSVRQKFNRQVLPERSKWTPDIDFTPAELLESGTWALFNWIFDLAVLFLMLVATKSKVAVLGVILAYALGALAANLPITPGGLGVVEGSMTVALVAFGGHETSAVAAVILYRLFSFWMILPLGAASHGILALVSNRQNVEPVLAVDEGEGRGGVM